MHSFKKWQLRIFILCWVAYASIYFARVNLSVAIPFIQKDFNFDKAQVGLIGSLFFWIYGIGQLVNGYVGDKVSSRVFIFVGLIVTSLSNIFFGVTSNFTLMLVFWAVNGYFQSMLWGSVTKTLSYWYSHEERSRVAIAISTSSVSGYIFSWGLSGKILSCMSWRWAFFVPGISTFMYSFIWFFRIKNHPEEVGFESPNIYVNTQEEISNELERPSESLWSIIYKTKLWYIAIACFAQGIIKEGIGFWAPSFIMEKYNLDFVSSVILFIPVMNFIGTILAGWLNKKLKYREKLATIILFGVSMIMIFGLVKFGNLGISTALIFLGLSSATMHGANTLLLGVIPMGFAKYSKVSSVAGFLDFCSYLASGFSAFLTGIIVKYHGWSSIMIIWVLFAAVGIFALVASWKSDRNYNALAAVNINK